MTDRVACNNEVSTLMPWPEVCRGIEIGRLRRDLDAVIGGAPCALRADGNQGLSVGADNLLQVWDCETPNVLTRIPLSAKPRCCAISADGLILAAGLHGGKVHFYKLENQISKIPTPFL